VYSKRPGSVKSSKSSVSFGDDLNGFQQLSLDFNMVIQEDIKEYAPSSNNQTSSSNNFDSSNQAKRSKLKKAEADDTNMTNLSSLNMGTINSKEQNNSKRSQKGNATP